MYESSMHTIYSQAYLTIVVASGEDCEAGIPGIQVRNNVRHTSLVNGLDIATSFLPIERELSASKWSSRAWTLQEFVLSRRCLVFTTRQIFFCCGDETRREEVNEYLITNLSLQNISVLPILRPTFLSNRARTKIFKSEYIRLVSSYAGRELSLPGDIIKAFSGIMGALGPRLGDFLWGIPRTSGMLTYGLAWAYHGLCYRRPGFPSWSWAGWHFDALSQPQSEPSNQARFEGSIVTEKPDTRRSPLRWFGSELTSTGRDDDTVARMIRFGSSSVTLDAKETLPLQVEHIFPEKMMGKEPGCASS